MSSLRLVRLAIALVLGAALGVGVVVTASSVLGPAPSQASPPSSVLEYGNR